MRYLNWNDFNFCVQSITKSCSQKKFSGVYGFPRGGLCLAVAISHSLRIPFLTELQPNALVVDDVYETGLTLNKALGEPGTTAFVWFSKIKPDWWHSVETCAPEEWLVFPWEEPSFAVKEQEAYLLDRHEFT